MLARLSTLLFALPFVSALTVGSTAGWTTGGTVTLTWTATTTDPGTFSIELVNTAFNNEYAIGNNIPTANGQLTFQLPQVPAGGGYTVNFIAPNNVNQVYASSGNFNIGAATTSSDTASSTSSTPVTTISSATSSASFTIPSFTTPASSASSVPIFSTTGSSSASSSTPSNFGTSGAASFKMAGVVPVAALALSAVAGAAMVF